MMKKKANTKQDKKENGKSKNKSNPKNMIKLRPSLKSFWVSWFFFTLFALAAMAPGAIIDVMFEYLPGFASKIFGTDSNSVASSQFYLLIIGAVVATAILLRYIAYPLLANRYFVDDDHVVEVYGLIKKERKTTKLEHILTVNEDIGYIGRVLKFGDVVFFTAGSGGEDVRMNNIDNPEEVAADIQERADRASESHGQDQSHLREASENQQKQIDKLESRIEEMVERTAQLREKVAVMGFRLDALGAPDATPTSDTDPRPTAAASGEEASEQNAPDNTPSSSYSDADNAASFTDGEPALQIPAERECPSDLDLDDFSDDLSEPEPSSRSERVAPSHQRPPTRNPGHDEDGNLEFPHQQKTESIGPGGGDEFFGLMARPGSAE